MRDIENNHDIQILVNGFYELVRKDNLIGAIFEEVAKVDWDAHLPVMYQFWESILFDTGDFKGNPMVKHIALSKKTAMEAEHFERWLELLEKNINQHFSGEMAEKAKQRAKNIAGLMLHKIKTAF